MISPTLTRLYCLILSFFFFSFLHAQKKITAADSVQVRNSIARIEWLTQQARYDSAIGMANQVLLFSKMHQFKTGEAAACSQLAEIMLLNGKLADMRKYDSLVLPLAQQAKDTPLLIGYWNRSGVYHMESGKHKDAEKDFITALGLGLEKKQSKKTAEVYSNLASMYLAQADKDKAVEWFFKALRLYEKNNNETGQGETYSNISSVYYLMGKTDEAIDYQKKSIQLRERQNDIQGLVITHVNIGQLYILKQNYPQALSHLQQSVQYAELANNPRSKASAYSGMSVYFNRIRDFTTALNWQSKAIKLFEETNNVQMLSRLYVAAGNLANVTKDSITALNYYNKALALATQLDNKENISNAYEKLSAFYLSHNDYEKAYTHYRTFINYKDSIAGKSTLAKIEEVKTRYETEKKDNEIARLSTEQRIRQLEIEKQKAIIAGNMLEAKQKENEIKLLSQDKLLQQSKIAGQSEELEKQELVAKNNRQELQLREKENQLRQKQLKSQKQVRNLLIAGFILVGLFAFMYFNRYQLKRKLEQQETMLAMRNNISQDLHDDIGASLSNINILNELARRTISQPEKSTGYLSKAAEDIQRISESLSDIVWNINPRYDDLQNLFIRMKRYAADMLDGKNIQGEFIFPAEEISLKLSMTQRRDLYLIFKEAVNNLVKYSVAAHALIQVTANDHSIAMVVKDDGKGFDRTQLNGGNGLTNMEQRAAFSGGSLTIQSKPGAGTSVKLDMKIS